MAAIGITFPVWEISVSAPRLPEMRALGYRKYYDPDDLAGVLEVFDSDSMTDAETHFFLDNHGRRLSFRVNFWNDCMIEKLNLLSPTALATDLTLVRTLFPAIWKELDVDGKQELVDG